MDAVAARSARIERDCGPHRNALARPWAVCPRRADVVDAVRSAASHWASRRSGGAVSRASALVAVAGIEAWLITGGRSPAQGNTGATTWVAPSMISCSRLSSFWERVDKAMTVGHLTCGPFVPDLVTVYLDWATVSQPLTDLIESGGRRPDIPRACVEHVWRMLSQHTPRVTEYVCRKFGRCSDGRS